MLLIAATGLATADPAQVGASREPTATQLLAAGAFPIDCYAPAGNPDPKTDLSAWEARDEQNELCSTQRLTDELTNPAFLRLSGEEVASYEPSQILSELNDLRVRSWGGLIVAGGDPFRTPTRWTAAGRGQYQEFDFISTTGAKLQAELYSPNPHPDRRYPIVTFTPGLQESKEQAWWFADGLAESGYVVLVIDPQGQGDSEVTSHDTDPSRKCNPICGFPTDDKAETQAAIDFALSTPSHPYKYGAGANGKGTLQFNPLWREVDRAELGIAGHSLGATAATPIGQADSRVKAVISYDNLDQSIPESLVPKIHAPALYFATDYAFPTFAVPKIPGGHLNPEQHWPAYDQMRKAGVDSMVVVPRASTHYEWDQQSAAGSLPASRLGQVTSFYYTLAWFDAYLKHEASGFRRLVALRYDDSADKHSIGGGTYSVGGALADPTDPTAGNESYRIGGMCVADTLSFYFSSAYSLEGGRLQSDNMRNRSC